MTIEWEGIHCIILCLHYRTVVALGYHITLDKPPSRIRSIRLPNDPFLQPNGYKPAPLDLSAITLTAKLEELVDHLAENTHNIWAKERISEGWTYGLNEVRSTSSSVSKHSTFIKPAVSTPTAATGVLIYLCTSAHRSSFPFLRTCVLTACLKINTQDPDYKRSPHLVPYSKVDEAIKIANW